MTLLWDGGLFLQQKCHCFSNIQVDIADLPEWYNEARKDIPPITGCMESIKVEVTYFRGFVDRQEERQLRQIRREEE